MLRWVSVVVGVLFLICCFSFFSRHVAVVVACCRSSCSSVVVVICSLCFNNYSIMFQLFFLFVTIICLRSFNFIIPVLELLLFFFC